MKKTFHFIFLYIFIQPLSFAVVAQNFEDSIREADANQILNFLSSDELKGRGNFTPELIHAGHFISGKFKEYGLQQFPGSLVFYQAFNAGDARSLDRDDLFWNSKRLKQSQFFLLTSEMIPGPKNLKDFHIVEYNGIINDSIYLAHWLDTTSTLIWLKQTQPANWQSSSESFRDPGFPPSKEILFVTAPDSPLSLEIATNTDYRKNVLFNIIGVLPGKTKANEIVIFSAHYDHLGVGDPEKGDSIYNGANDDASGTTALLLLAKYFALRNDNDRTIFFCAFAGEELGLLGSTFLASKLKPDGIKAMINIEMIGRTNIAGTNSFFLTGAEYSNLENIMRTNLRSSSVKLRSDPGTGHLFQRSDNFPFALKGVPAHTVMCSDDEDGCYHKPCDEAVRIDVHNMTTVVKAIALSSLSIVSGNDTPRRINPNDLNN
ncbi:MAG TPA: M28 family peptidase [Chitinophagaceae bacterium]